MNTNKQVLFWLLSFAAFVLFLSVFQNILLPFVAGMALAYLLDPIADYLEEHGSGASGNRHHPPIISPYFRDSATGPSTNSGQTVDCLS